ncbi:hypothetical protein BJY04DRAFT_194155 [Aspergillus karnatakaensis]|uniref:uncharacterized protein n=1 Tax=Aspergillus karnatakaensis TaxID=1810916 RepID=UPI003CCE28F5
MKSIERLEVDCKYIRYGAHFKDHLSSVSSSLSACTRLDWRGLEEMISPRDSG